MIGGSGWRAVVRSGTACVRGGGSSVIVPSISEEVSVGRASVDLEPRSYLTEGLGVGGVEESVLDSGGEGSTLGPA